jgi:uncharacterized protein (DUF433 family)
MKLTPWEGRIDLGGEPTVAGSDATVADLIGRLEAGTAPADLARELQLSPSSVIAALAFNALGDDRDEAGPSLVQAPPRRRALEPALSERALADLFPAMSRPSRLALSAGLLQVHDFWDDSHNAAQQADDLGESSVSAYWHGIAHRREPDASNANYWFRRVGRHPLYGPLAAAARPLLAANPPLADRLIARGTWDPSAFIAYCTGTGARDEALARRLQRVEMALLLMASMPGE